MAPLHRWREKRGGERGGAVVSICASLGSAATGRGRGGLARRGFHGKMIDDASSCHIKETVSSHWRPAKMHTRTSTQSA